MKFGRGELKGTPFMTFALVGIACSGCLEEEPPVTQAELATTPSDYSYDGAELIDKAVVDVHTGWSPAHPTPTAAQVEDREALDLEAELGTFNFCGQTPAGEVDLSHAAWLAFFSANVYAHFGHLAPQMRELGFVNPDGGERDWSQCALDLKLVENDQLNNKRLFEGAIMFDTMRPYLQERFLDNDRWGPCAREWFERTDDDGEPIYRGAGLPFPAFQAWLLTEPELDNYVQFGCGGEWSYEDEVYEEGSTQAVVLRRDGDPATGRPPVVIVAFRGTETTWNDISVDLAFFKIDLETEERQEQGWGPGWGKVHRGFFNAYRSLDEQARKYGNYFLSEVEPPEIYITGHSLGGALATILASRILQDMEYQDALGQPPLNLRGVYTFGSPRVGDEQFASHLEELADKYDVTLARFRNADDTITNVPAKTVGFVHTGTMLLMEESTPGSHELDVGITRYDIVEDEPDQRLGVAGDHSMAGYKTTYDDDPESAGFNTSTHVIKDTGYYRRVHEAYLSSKEEGSDLAGYNHCD